MSKVKKLFICKAATLGRLKLIVILMVLQTIVYLF